MDIEQIGSVIRKAVVPIARSGYGLDPRDLAQDAMVAILEGKAGSPCETMVYRRAGWGAKNRRRQRIREYKRTEPLTADFGRHVESGELGGDVRVLRFEIAALLEMVMRQLPDRDRSVLKWIFRDEMPKGEVAKRLNVSQARVAQLRTAAQEKMRRALAAEGITSTHQCL